MCGMLHPTHPVTKEIQNYLHSKTGDVLPNIDYARDRLIALVRDAVDFHWLVDAENAERLLKVQRQQIRFSSDPVQLQPVASLSSDSWK